MIFKNKLFGFNLQKNFEVFFVLIIILITTFITHFYNESKKIYEKRYINLINNLYFQKTLNHIIDEIQPKFDYVEHRVTQNDSLNTIFKENNVANNEAYLLEKNLKNKNSFRNLKAGQLIKFTIDRSNNTITKIHFPVNDIKRIELVRNIGTNTFEFNEILTNLRKNILFKEGKIKQSLYKSATDLNIQPNIIIEFARVYGFQVDFQRDIRKNDTFQIIYEVFKDDNNKIKNTGKILFADLNLSGQSNALYYFDKKDQEGHYDINGKSIKKALMKTPINGARLSSSFGLRKHPIDGFTKMHKGTDFAAPMGTPIMASGDGVVVKAGWCGGGGNCIKIRHNSSYSTVYAHLSKFASATKKGRRVKQGQIIGYVGSTGKSTGPHLHYEVIFNGKRVNSQTLKLPSGKVLKDKNREIFEVNKIKIDVLKSELIASLN
tara:strand:- start:85 stop:1386 length:1302 start_codon:yes stop_codon:yes gene_type:complete